MSIKQASVRLGVRTGGVGERHDHSEYPTLAVTTCLGRWGGADCRAVSGGRRFVVRQIVHFGATSV